MGYPRGSVFLWFCFFPPLKLVQVIRDLTEDYNVFLQVGYASWYTPQKAFLHSDVFSLFVSCDFCLIALSHVVYLFSYFHKNYDCRTRCISEWQTSTGQFKQVNDTKRLYPGPSPIYASVNFYFISPYHIFYILLSSSGPVYQSKSQVYYQTCTITIIAAWIKVSGIYFMHIADEKHINN